MDDRGTRAAIILGIVPIIVGIAYYVFQESIGTQVTAESTGTIDPAGATMLIAFGIAIGFGFLVILRGARDL